jgi:hypothetical protein
MALDDYSLTPKSESDSQSSIDQTPDWQIAAENHNYGNGNPVSFDPTTWGDALYRAGEFGVASVVSGFNGFVNTGVAVNNMLGGDAEKVNTAVELAELDSDLGRYYLDNQKAIDTTGYILGSMIAGVAGIKVLNAGQKVFAAAETTGFVGANLGEATGLGIPWADFRIAKAGVELAKTQGTFSWIEANTLKAVAAGVGQAALESAAFEVAALSTQAASPFLEGQDTKDIITNMLVGVGVGTVIGGAFNLAKISTGIKGIVNDADRLSAPYRYIPELGDKAGESMISPADRILVYKNELDIMPEVKTVDNIYVDSHTALRAEKVNKLNNLIGQNLQKMAEGEDTQLSNGVWRQLQVMESDNFTASVSNARTIVRAGITTEAERKAAKELADTIKTLDVDSIAAHMNKIDTQLGNKYVVLTGEGVGDVIDAKPLAFDVRDMYPSTEKLLDVVSRKNFKVTDGFDLLKATHEDTQLRYIWADRAASLSDKSVIQYHDLPLLEKALATDGLTSFRIQNADKSITTIGSKREALDAVIQAKKLVIEKLATKIGKGKLSQDEVAKITNTTKSFLGGEIPTNVNDAYFARQAATRDYAKSLKDSGISLVKNEDLSLSPTMAKVSYDTKPLTDVNGNILDGMTLVKAKYKAYQAGINTVSAKHMGDLDDRIYLGTDKDLLGVTRIDRTAGAFTSANGDYGSVVSNAQNTGAAKALFERKLKDATTETLNAPLVRAAGNPESMVEFSAINERLAGIPSKYKYVLSDDGSELLPRELKNYLEGIEAGETNLKVPDLPQGIPESIPVNRQETADLIRAHIENNDNNLSRTSELRGAQGLTQTKQTGHFVPMRPNPKDYPYHAMVVDKSIGGTGQVSMIHATNAKELEAMISKVPPEYRVITDGASADYHKALGDFTYERTLNSSTIDSSLASAGINSQFKPISDPQLIAERMLEWHHNNDYTFASELVSAKLDKQFSELRRLGERYGDLEASAYSTSKSYAEGIANNPYYNIVKTALNISKTSEYPLLQGFNSLLDKSFSKLGDVASNLIGNAKTHVELDKVNQIFEEAGIKSAYKDAADMLLANHSAPRGELSSFIRKANGIISTLVLRTDPLNALNNSLGSVLLQSAEWKSIMRKYEQAGLSGVADTTIGKLGIPGTKLEIRSAGSLIRNGLANMVSGSDKEFETYARANGWVTSYHDLLRSTMDDLTLAGNESVPQLQGRLASALGKTKEILGKSADTLGKYTGNQFAEDTNRYVSAYMMNSVTKQLVDRGVMTQGEATSYINTFVNRTQTNIIASQRPLAFQGPVGHAVGLFQSYQFNLMQQLFRYTAEGGGKDAAMLMGMQGTMYGMNGLPAFQFLNQHIIGTASGNTAHRDLYDLTYGVAGKQAGDWILYGVPSNILGTNIFTRGDINPRNVTVLPVNPADIPLVQVTGKILGNISDTIGKIANGGDVMTSLLQGIEHNGLSRPLAGMAQIAEAGLTTNGQSYSTTSKGSLLYANDLMTLANISRLVGGKPFDEAITNDAAFRISAYNAVDAQRKQTLSEAVKTSFAGGNNPTQDQVEKFAHEYAKIGGKAVQFNKFMLTAMKQSNTPKANLISEALKNPMSQSMQQVMGGEKFDTTYEANPNQ